MEQKADFAIEGMSCSMCVEHVTKALESVPNVTKADVSLEDKSATVYHNGADAGALQAAVDEEGYTATPK